MNAPEGYTIVELGGLRWLKCHACNSMPALDDVSIDEGLRRLAEEHTQMHLTVSKLKLH